MKRFEGKWLPPADKYKEACREISINLDGFKRNSIYSCFIGNDLRDEQTAIKFYSFIKENYPFLLEGKTINKFLINDNIGNPMIYGIENLRISPGTLRFIKVLGDILAIDNKINNIIEIGSGYGGQALIIKTYSNDIDYSLVDIPESLLVSKSYLNKNNCDVTFVSTDEIITKDYYDLVISDYCLSELDLTGIAFYVNNIINKCKYGYFTVNSVGVTLDKIVEQLNTVFGVVEINKERPKTTYHDNNIIICKNNKILI
jgi:hypothetical protein